MVLRTTGTESNLNTSTQHGDVVNLQQLPTLCLYKEHTIKFCSTENEAEQIVNEWTDFVEEKDQIMASFVGSTDESKGNFWTVNQIPPPQFCPK